MNQIEAIVAKFKKIVFMFIYMYIHARKLKVHKIY